MIAMDASCATGALAWLRFTAPDFSRSAACAAMVLSAKSDAMVNTPGHFASSSVCRRVSSREFPPASKKPRSMSGAPSSGLTSCQTCAMASCEAVRVLSPACSAAAARGRPLSRLRSALPELLNGISSTSWSRPGHMYAGSRAASSLWMTDAESVAPSRGSRKASSESYPPTLRTRTTACDTPVQRPSAASISPSSIRKPRTFTWSSLRPRYSTFPSDSQRPRSPVRYMRLPGMNGSARKRSAVSSLRFTYPRATCTPPM